MRRLVLPEDMKHWTLDLVNQLRDINAATLAPGSLKVKVFYGVFADGFWNLGELDSVATGRQP